LKAGSSVISDSARERRISLWLFPLNRDRDMVTNGTNTESLRAGEGEEVATAAAATESDELGKCVFFYFRKRIPWQHCG